MGSDDDKREARIQARLRQGGQRSNYLPGHVLHERTGGETQRVTYLDRTNHARLLMSSRLSIPDGLRSVGNLYGASVQEATMGLGKAFAQEAVDGGHNGATGGVPLRMVEARQVADIAQARLASLPPSSHRCHAKAKHGFHRPISARHLVDGICVSGLGVTEIALRFGWWIMDNDRTVIRKKQSQKLKADLVEALREIDAAWADRGIDARGILGVVEVRT